MEDECSIEELTAFLESSDEEEGDNTGHADTETKQDYAGAAELGDDEIQAFLDASDLEDEEGDSQPNTATPVSYGSTPAEELEDPDFEDVDDEELGRMLEEDDIASPQGTEDTGSSQSNSQSQDLLDQNTTEAPPQDHVKSEMEVMAERIRMLEAMLKEKAAEPKPPTSGSSGSKQTTSSKSPATKHSTTSKSPATKHTTKHKSTDTKHTSKSHTSGIKHTSATSKSPGSKSSAKSSDIRSPRTSSSSEHSGNNISNKSSGSKVHSGSSKSSSVSSQSGKSSQHQQRGMPDSRSKHTANEMANKQLKHSLDRGEKSDDNPFFTTTQTDTTQAKRPVLSGTSRSMEGHHVISTSAKAPDNHVEPEMRVDSKSLFGESDDSDWDELDGEEKAKLSEEGREMKKLLGNKRVAHTASYDPATIKKPNLKNWSETTTSPRPFLSTSSKPAKPEKPALNPETGTVSGKHRLREEYRPKPSTLQQEDHRESVTDPYCGIRIINPRISMSEFQNKMSGRTMMKIPRLLAKTGLADLQKDNWVTVGVVVHKTEPRQSAAGKTYCIWKLSDLQSCDKTVTFFLFGNVYKDHWKNDLGVVVGLLNPTLMDKAEKAQSEVAFTINHPGQMLVLGISKDLGRCRGTTKAGQPCSSVINKMQGEYCTYHVQAAYRKTSSKRTELQASTGLTPKAFDQKRQQQQNKQGFFFYGGNTFSTMKPQSKSSKDQMNLQKLQNFEGKKAAGKITTMSLHDLEPKENPRLKKMEEKDKALLDLLSVPTAGAMNFVKHMVTKDKVTPGETSATKPIMESASAKDLLSQHKAELQQRRVATSRLKATPTLGRGLSTGQDISLDVPVKKMKGTASAELAKQLAIMKVKSKGGIEKEDPNAVRKKLTSPEAKDKIRKRVAAEMDSDEKSPSQKKESSQPPKKRSKFLGDLDLNSPEVQKLLKAKSKHSGALAEAEAEYEEKYFSALEQKEKMEDKMAGIMEVAVDLVVCLKCKYKYFSLAERCKKEGHPWKKVKGTKRFFKCKQCKRRTVSLEKIHTAACKDCGNTNFERVSMLKERSGPKLESEELCIRGNESKYVGSTQGKTFLNV